MFKHAIETISILASILVVVHYYFYTNKNAKYTFLFFSGALLIGTISEIAAMLTTDSYHYDGFRWYIYKVPVFVAVGWCNVFYFIYQITRQITFRLSNHPRYLWIVGFVGGLVGLCMDLFFDPVAASLEWWEWKNGGPYYGVSTGNSVGWIFFASGFCFVYNPVLSKNWKFRKRVNRFYLLLQPNVLFHFSRLKINYQDSKQL